MTDEELWKVRALIGEARASSANRHSEFLAAYGDLMAKLRDFWFEHAVPGTTLSAELKQEIEAFGEKWRS